MPVEDGAVARTLSTGGAFLPQQRLNFCPDLQGQGALRGIAGAGASSHWVLPKILA
jgi:hypothetical protein